MIKFSTYRPLPWFQWLYITILSSGTDELLVYIYVYPFLPKPRTHYFDMLLSFHITQLETCFVPTSSHELCASVKCV